MSQGSNEGASLRARVEVADDRAVVRLAGSIAAENVNAFQTALERAGAAEVVEVLVDLRQVLCVGSRAVAVLLAFWRELQPDRRLVLARPTEAVRNVFVLTGLVRFVALLDELPPGLETAAGIDGAW